MPQYCSRLHIKVSSPKIWSRFEAQDDAGFDLAKLANTNQTSFICDDEWASDEVELKGIVEALSKPLGKEGIIIADTTDINVDPYTCCILYLGRLVRTIIFSNDYDEDYDENDDENCEMQFETKISDIPGWLSYGKFSISKAEKAQLFRCFIAVVDDHFEEFSTDLHLPNKTYLRETSFNDRAANIEKTIIGEEVYFIHSESSYDSMRLEVMSDFGSLGYLPSDISAKLAPALLYNRLTYTARIVNLVKLTRRNKHAKSPIIAINIQAEITDKDVPMKTSVSKFNFQVIEEAGKIKE